MNLAKRPDGTLERTRSNLTALIDRYIPRHTREEVWEMQRIHEERVWDLLSTIHEYRERNQRMAEHMDQMEKEFYSQVRVPVSLGRFETDVERSVQFQERVFSIRWSLPPYQMNYRISDRDLHLISADETPHLFEMVGRQFEEQVKHDLLPKLKAEYLKLYSQFAASNR